MKVSRHSAVSLTAAALLAATFATPVTAFAGRDYQVQPISADFVPTREEVRDELSLLAQRLESGRKASFYSGEAAGEYLVARRLFEFGLYDQAFDHARQGVRDLPAIPNWVQPRTASR